MRPMFLPNSRAKGKAPDSIRGKSVKPQVVETKPKRPARSRKAAVEEDEPDLIAAR